MSNVPDYSQYIAVKKIGVAQTANTNTSITKGRVAYRYDGYFPLYRGIRLPINALLSNKFTSSILPSSGPAGPFDPSMLPTLMDYWFDASDTSTITLSGSNVIGWADRSANKYNLVRSGSDVITQSTFSGKNVIVMNNTRMNTSLSLVPWRTKFVVFTVFRANLNSFIIAHRDGDTYRNYVYTGNGALLNVNNGGAATDSVISPGTPITNAGNWFIWTIGYNNGLKGTPYSLNGTPRTTTDMSAIVGDSTPMATLYINGTNTGAFGSTTVAEVLIYNNTLDLADSQKIEGYLAWKWGLEANLPVGHPYRAAAP